MQSQSGTALVTVTFILILLGITLGVTLQATTFSTRIREGALHSLRARHEARAALVEKLSALPSESGLVTLRESATVGRYTVHDSLSLYQNIPSYDLLARTRLNQDILAAGELLPGFDLKRLAVNESACEKNWWEIASGRTRDGYLLESASIKAAALCTSLLPQSTPVFLGANLDQEDYSLETSSITILGYLNLKTLQLNIPAAFVMAAGDLHIKKLECGVAEGCRVFLISLTGSTTIEQLSGSISIKSFARIGDNLAAAITPGADYLLPPIERVTILGFD